MKNKVEEVVNKIKLYLQENNIKCNIVDEEYVLLEDGLKCSGCFVDYPKPALYCASKKSLKKFLTILIHEYCHCNQFIEGSKYWSNVKHGKFEAMDIIGLWLENKISLTDEQKDLYFNASLLVEADCEKRTVEFIISNNLTDIIDVEEYIQQANAYILFYHIVRKYKKWYTVGKEPNNIYSIYSKMPKDFNMDYLEISPELEKLYMEIL